MARRGRSVLAGFLEGAVGQVEEQAKATRERSSKLEEILLTQKVKQLYPSASDLASLAYLQQLGILPQPQDGTQPQSPSQGIPKELPAGSTIHMGKLTLRGPQRERTVLPEGQTSGMQGAAEAVSRLQRLKELIEANPDIETGPAALAFKRQGLGRWIGNLGLQYGTEPKKARRITDMSMRANQLQDDYRRIVTASQAGFPELQFLKTAQPSTENQTRENLLMAIGATNEELRNKIETKLRILDASGYDVTPLRQELETLLATIPSAGTGSATTDDPVIRTGLDESTGRRVGQTRSGKVVPLD